VVADATSLDVVAMYAMTTHVMGVPSAIDRDIDDSGRLPGIDARRTQGRALRRGGERGRQAGGKENECCVAQFSSSRNQLKVTGLPVQMPEQWRTVIYNLGW
jgi:hypothetical protein